MKHLVLRFGVVAPSTTVVHPTGQVVTSVLAEVRHCIPACPCRG